MMLAMQTSATTPDSNRRFRFSLLALFITLTLLSVAIGGACFFVRNIERTVHDAYRAWAAGDLLVDYMKANANEWPHDWSDVRAYMEAHPNERMTAFGYLPDYIEIDFAFDPESVNTDVSFDENHPQFRAVWLRNGSTTRYAHSGPNEIIFDYHKKCAAASAVVPATTAIDVDDPAADTQDP